MQTDRSLEATVLCNAALQLKFGGFRKAFEQAARNTVLKYCDMLGIELSDAQRELLENAGRERTLVILDHLTLHHSLPPGDVLEAT